MALRATEFDRLYSAAEFERMREFAEGYELVEGRVVRKAVPGGEHSRIARLIIRAYDRFDPDEKQGMMLQEASVILGPRNVPIPDLSYWKAERGVKLTKGAMPLPDLAIEIHSPSDLKSSTDLAGAMIKVQKLLEAGVRLVWVVYPNRFVVEVYDGNRGYELGPIQSLDRTESLTAEPVISGFTLSLADIFDYELEN